MKPIHLNGSASASRGNVGVTTSVAGVLLDCSLLFVLVFGGCCSYVPTSLALPDLSLTISFLLP